MTQEVRDKLKHLYLGIVDLSGPGGEYENIPNVVVDRDHIYDRTVDDQDYPRSNVQSTYPNRVVQQSLWDFASLCPNPESLGIRGTHFLDLDRLNWNQGSTSRGLRVLHLKRVWASISTIINLLSPSPSLGGPSNVSRIWLWDVKIKPDGGNWADLFKFLLICPELELAVFRSLNYFTGHAKYDHVHRMAYGDLSDAVWTTDKSELKPLHRLCRKLVQRAGGEVAAHAREGERRPCSRFKRLSGILAYGSIP